MVADSDRVSQVLEGLHGLGLRLAVDHFGSGHFSLASLGRLPLEEIKIDQAFIHKMCHGNSETMLVRSMIDLAHNIGLKAVAKGVETPQARDQLLEMGCDRAQGFLFCVPCGFEDMTAWLEKRLSQGPQVMPRQS